MSLHTSENISVDWILRSRIVGSKDGYVCDSDIVKTTTQKSVADLLPMWVCNSDHVPTPSPTGEICFHFFPTLMVGKKIIVDPRVLWGESQGSIELQSVEWLYRGK